MLGSPAGWGRSPATLRRGSCALSSPDKCGQIAIFAPEACNLATLISRWRGVQRVDYTATDDFHHARHRFQAAGVGARTFRHQRLHHLLGHDALRHCPIACRITTPALSLSRR